MCRFIVYKGVEPIQLSHLVTRPKHSITNQAFESKLRFPSSRPMNADGFGIGWYDPQPPPPVATVVPQSTTADHFDQSSNPTAPSTRNDTSGDEEDSPVDGTERIKTKDGKPLKAANGSSKPNGLQTRSPSTSRGDSNAPSRTNSPSTADGAGPTIGAENIVPGRDDQEAKEILRKREIERELENERPCMFKSLSPAWSSANLERLAEKIRSPLVFAHVRASTLPGAPSEDNCHPWSFGKLMWMHNGEASVTLRLCGFTKIKRKLQASLPEELFLYPSGYTDSEWAFMVFLSKLKDPHARSFTHLELRNAMMETLKYINELLKEAGVTEPSLLNYVVTDGETVIATRYISSKTSEASSLFFSSGTSFDEYQEGGHYRMTKADKRENIIMIASEPLTFERSDWMEVKTNTMIVITPKMNVLQIPIIDEYWVPPKDPAASARSRDFAISLGFGHGFAASEQEANA